MIKYTEDFINSVKELWKQGRTATEIAKQIYPKYEADTKFEALRMRVYRELLRESHSA
jgi:hypothetical protein